MEAREVFVPRGPVCGVAGCAPTIAHVGEGLQLREAERARLHGLAARFARAVHEAPLPDRDPNGRYDPQQMIDPRTGERYIVSENHAYDARRQLNVMSFYYRRAGTNGEPYGPESRAELVLRVLFPRELDHFLRVSGFEVLGDYDDFERTAPFSGRGGRRVVIAKKR